MFSTSEDGLGSVGVSGVFLADHGEADPMEHELDLAELERQAAEEFPDVIEALRVFEIGFGHYLQAVQAEQPRLLYSASSTQEN